MLWQQGVLQARPAAAEQRDQIYLDFKAAVENQYSSAPLCHK